MTPTPERLEIKARDRELRKPVALILMSQVAEAFSLRIMHGRERPGVHSAFRRRWWCPN